MVSGCTSDRTEDTFSNQGNDIEYEEETGTVSPGNTWFWEYSEMRSECESACIDTYGNGEVVDMSYEPMADVPAGKYYLNWCVCRYRTPVENN